MVRPRRPRLLPALGLFVVVLLATSGWIGIRAVLAQGHLEAARTDLAAAREVGLRSDVAAARSAVEQAGERTRRARALTSDPVWRLAASVPFYGETAQTVRGLAVASDDLVRRVLPQGLDGAELLDPTQLRGPDGVVEIALLRRAEPALASAAAEARRLQQDVLELPASDVAGSVARARRALESQVEELAGALDRATTVLGVAPALLGEDRPRRYLILIQQTGESRGTGGLFGGFVELVADAGRVTLASSGSNRDLRNFLIPVPDGVPADFADRYGPFRAFELWQNANLSPDLPVVAEVVQARWQAQGGAPLDGVAVVDPAGLASILTGTGPLQLPDGRTVEPAELERYLAVDQYAGVPLIGGGQLDRKDRLEDVAAVVGSRLTTGGGDTELLLRGVAAAVRSGHLRVSSRDPALEPVLREQGIDGGLPDGDAPLAYPVVYNVSEGKLDYFLDRAVRYTAQGCETERRRSEVSVTLTNTAPAAETLPPYLTIRNEGGKTVVSNVNRVTLSVYGTRGALLQRALVDGEPTRPEEPLSPRVTTDEEGGLPVWSILLDLPSGQPRTVVLELSEPTAAGSARLPEQPLARPLVAAASVPVC